MNTGFETIGNAILICYDQGRSVLVTDPWITGGAYFQSWALSHEIPEEQMKAIKAAPYAWISHGHPDHLSGPSLKLLRDKKILLPDHVGRRIYEGLKLQGYNVSILKDRVWTKLSDHIRILSIADYNQDAILLVDLNGRLIVNSNDAGELGWEYFVRKEIQRYKISFLLHLSGYGDADMINYFDKNGSRIPPPAMKRIPFGRRVALRTESFGAKYFLPFSSMHQYQRKDSLWANACVTRLTDYPVGFESKKCRMLPAYIRYDCKTDTHQKINPPETKPLILDPEEIGDSWKEPLEASDLAILEKYFKSIVHLGETMDFIRLRVAGRDHEISFGSKRFNRGITFEAPRNSLMTAVKFEIFDDLLIGNFMKTTLHGKWSRLMLYPDFNPTVPKYADNARAKTKDELKAYFAAYRRRAFWDYLRHRFESQCGLIFRTLIPYESKFYDIGRLTYYRLIRGGG